MNIQKLIQCDESFGQFLPILVILPDLLAQPQHGRHLTDAVVAQVECCQLCELFDATGVDRLDLVVAGQQHLQLRQRVDHRRQQAKPEAKNIVFVCSVRVH